MNLAGKNILFLGQQFYDYHTKISNQLESFGLKVHYFPNIVFRQDPIVANDVKAMLMRKANSEYKIEYASKVLRDTKGIQFDYLLCTGGFSVTEYLVKKIKDANPGIKTVLYFWDSFNIYNYRSICPLFDRVFSFDRHDCQVFSDITYLPLFYTEEYSRSNNNANPDIDIDLLYIGSVGQVSINRCKVLARVEQIAKERNYNAFLWLLWRPVSGGTVSKIIHVLAKTFWPPTRRYVSILEDSLKRFSFLRQGSLSRAETADLFKRARCIIDIPVPNQAGLTIRSIETLAMGKKLITTNGYIREEPFYNESYIRITDENNVVIDDAFLRAPFTPPDISYLRLDNWLKTILQD